ncbi:putative transcriptional G2/M transition protein [Tubulinosema ratisbonensis]|uniref:Putative transcriptional G2/M transition protein n=1 Tax=Tubulinosema ratisbonensis TaxID=291195 RepID=A0A437AI88_9MICR|nr:putative transcriptional G2/M transition protein [Tubulinosema ratisbonensis]
MDEDSECFIDQTMKTISNNNEKTLLKDQSDIMFSQFEISQNDYFIFPSNEFYFEHKQFTRIPRENYKEMNSSTQLCVKPTHNYLYITPYACHKKLKAEPACTVLPVLPYKKKGRLKYGCENKACTKEYLSKNGLAYHKKVGCKSKNIIERFKCKFQGCNKVYKGASGLNYHLKRAHKK